MQTSDNILIYRLGSLGDIMVALPCFHLVRRAYPLAKITLLTNRPVSTKASLPMSILEHSGLCDDALDYPVGTRNLAALAAIRRSVRQLRPRGRLSSLRDYLFFRSCGIQKIIGTPFRQRDLYPQRTEHEKYESESQRLAARLSSLGKLDLSDRTLWKIGIRPEERNKARALLPTAQKTCLAVSIGTKLTVNDWGLENWQQLLSKLTQEIPEATLVILGSSDEEERSEELISRWSGPKVNLCAKTSPRISAAVLERCALFIGHDSGPMHLAAAAGTPTLGLFSWYNPPGQWYPGNENWKFIRALYPRLPAGGWNHELRMKKSTTEGIGLLHPELVFHSAMELWNPRRFEPAKAENVLT
jgi:ADP-heptose:LPS heptosyltransferase